MTSQSLPISATILVKNSAKYLHQVLHALRDFDEVLLLDNGCTDNTLDIAQQYPNTVVYQSPFIGFGPLKNLAAHHAKNDWIFNIDSDEVLSAELIHDLHQIDWSQTHHIYAFSRLNHYRGKLIKTCGWYPDFVQRLYNKTFTHFNDKQVHESLEKPDGSHVVHFNSTLNHYSFDGAEDLIQKMQQYSSLFAQQQRFRKPSSVTKAVLHRMSSFFKHYILKKGFLDGADGFIIANANAMGAYYKYIKLYEANQRLSVALIITTYNRPDALACVLRSVLVQTELPQEVIVADDGSTQETADLIHAFEPLFAQQGIKLIHSWQADDGFRLARSRNLAMAKASSEYLVVIDGDMVLHPLFIADHKRVAKPGVFIQGSRVVLPPAKTEELLQQSTYTPIKWYHRGIERRFEKRLSACHLPRLSKWLYKPKKDYLKGIRGCNMGFFREDAIAINGFNSDFIGWGREDSEFVVRLFNNGCRRQDIRFSAIAYHLYHHEAERDALPDNDQRLKQAIDQKIIRCENGIEQLPTVVDTIPQPPKHPVPTT